MKENELDIPTEVIDLPSQGKTYPSDNALSKGSVSIKYMTAKEEDILASQNLIKKGVHLDKLFESVVVDEDVDPDDILLGDKNAILLSTRLLGYGKDYKAEVTDPFTLERQEVEIDLSKVQVKDVDLDKLNGDNRYEFTLPKSQKDIVFKLLTHGDDKAISQEIQSLKRLSKNKSGAGKEVTTRLRYMIVEIDGKSDRGTINNYVNNNMLAQDSKALREYVKEIQPDMDLTFTFTSELSGESEVLDIPFGINFFYPSE